MKVRSGGGGGGGGGVGGGGGGVSVEVIASLELMLKTAVFWYYPAKEQAKPKEVVFTNQGLPIKPHATNWPKIPDKGFQFLPI